jgi:hypothetical protein
LTVPHIGSVRVASQKIGIAYETKAPNEELTYPKLQRKYEYALDQSNEVSTRLCCVFAVFFPRFSHSLFFSTFLLLLLPFLDQLQFFDS